jgi:hypothetical protein
MDVRRRRAYLACFVPEPNKRVMAVTPANRCYRTKSFDMKQVSRNE